MKALGYTDDLPLWRRFQLAVHDVGPRYIRALKTEGYDKLTLDQVQRAKTHGVTIDYIKAMKAEGYTVADDRGHRAHARSRRHRRSTSRACAAAGFKDATAGGSRARQGPRRHAGVRAGAARSGHHRATLDGCSSGMRVSRHHRRYHFVVRVEDRHGGFTSTAGSPIEDIVRAKDHGVSAEYIADMKDIGLKNLTLSDIVRLRDHGITPGFVNHVRAQGYKEDTVDGLIHLKNRGIWR